jgi:hypothetical protein
MEPRMRMTGWLGLVVLVCFGGGCATVRGDKQNVRVETDPPGATLVVNRSQSYTTPVEVQLKRKDLQTIQISKAGYRPIEFNLEAQWDGASLTDLALPGGSALLGLSAVTGSDRSFNRLAKITLEKSTEANPKPNVLYQHRGKLYTKEGYEAALKAEESPQRFMGDNN